VNRKGMENGKEAKEREEGKEKGRRGPSNSFYNKGLLSC